MTFKNTKQTISFNAVQIMSNDMEPEQSKLIDEVFFAKTDEEKEEAKKKLAETLTEAQEQELVTLGIKLPSDKIQVHYQLGNLLFDIYQRNVPIPKAPFPKMAEQNRRAKFVEALSEDVIKDLPDEIKNAAIEVMNDDEKWAKMNFYAWVDLTDGKKRFIPLNGPGINFYTDIINAACEVLMPPPNDIASEDVDGKED